MSSLDDPLLAPRPMTFQERLLEARAARAAAANAAAAAAAAAGRGGAGAGGACAGGSSTAATAPAPPYFFGAVAPSSTAPSSDPGTPTYGGGGGVRRGRGNSFDASAFQGARRKGAKRESRGRDGAAAGSGGASLAASLARRKAAAAKLAAAARSRAKGAAVAAFGAGGVLLALAGWGLVAALFLARSLAPAAVELGRDLWVDYTLSPAVGVASFLPEAAGVALPASFSPSYPPLANDEKSSSNKGGPTTEGGMSAADAARARAARPFPSGRRLDIWLSLEAPLDDGFSSGSYSPSAAAAAMVSPSSDLFQVRAELLSPEGKVLAAASRPAMLPRRPRAARLLRSLLLAPLVVAGLASGDEVAALRLPLFSGYREAADAPLVAVRVALQGRGSAANSRQLPNGGGGPAPPPALRSLTAHARQRLPLLAALLYRVRPGDALAAPLFLLGAAGVLVGSTVAAGAAAVWFASAKERAALAAAAAALERENDNDGASSPSSSRFGYGGGADGSSSFGGDDYYGGDGGPSPVGTGAASSYSGELSDTGEEEEGEDEDGDFRAAPEEFRAAAAAAAAAGGGGGGVASFQRRRQGQLLQRNESDATADFTPMAESVGRGGVGGGGDYDDDGDEEEEGVNRGGEEEEEAFDEPGEEFEEAPAAAPEPAPAAPAPSARRISLNASLSEAFRRRRARSSSVE